MSAPPAMPARPVALITGGAKRLGRAIAHELATAGWDLALHHRESADEAEATAQEARERGAGVLLLAADLADEAACERLVPAALARFGRLDAVVNNAALFEHDDVASFNTAAMERHWRTNTAPAVILARALHAAVKARGADARGCVVNLLDQKLWNPNPDHLSYTLSKAALETAGTLLAMALAPTLRVCGVAPGVSLPAGDMQGERFQRAFRMSPLERSSTPEDIARAVRFLLESPAITGTTLLVDGGQHLQPMRRDVSVLVRETT